MNLLSRRAAFSTLTIASGTAAAYSIYHHKHTNAPTKKMLPSYEATFSVPLECDTCIADIKGALSKVDGISSTNFSLPSRLVTITSTAAPSILISTIQSTGRDAILRGSGQPNSAAVCILELPPSTYHHHHPSQTTTAAARQHDGTQDPKHPNSSSSSPVRGLARLIQLSDQLTLLDLTLTSLPSGQYRVSLRSTGDISRGSASLGPVYDAGEAGRRSSGVLGTLDVDGKGRGNLVGEVGWRVWELVGRGMCVEKISTSFAAADDDDDDGAGRGEDGGKEGKEEVTEVVGVVARSAGVWENEKVVCGCSGKTVWEEREEMVGKGML
ncbi:MAG: hypothetical protein LQ345_005374 [Seirophora villosa]|nr:MAG: hypothetical protein LQ345_005374 [Seirophora villosa]